MHSKKYHQSNYKLNIILTSEKEVWDWRFPGPLLSALCRLSVYQDTEMS